MKDLELEIRIRNNRLKERRLSLGLSQREIAKAAGISQVVYCALETLNPKQRIFSKRTGDWVESIKKLARFFDVPETELFPINLIDVQFNKATKKVDAEELPLLVGGAQKYLMDENDNPEETLLHREQVIRLKKVLEQALTPRQYEMFNLFIFEGKSQPEIAKSCGVTKGTVSQVIQRAYRVLRSHVFRADVRESLKHDESIKLIKQKMRDHFYWQQVQRQIQVHKREKGRENEDTS